MELISGGPGGNYSQGKEFARPKAPKGRIAQNTHEQVRTQEKTFASERYLGRPKTLSKRDHHRLLAFRVAPLR
jgi:hypothetical protein